VPCSTLCPAARRLFDNMTRGCRTWRSGGWFCQEDERRKYTFAFARRRNSSLPVSRAGCRRSTRPNDGVKALLDGARLFVVRSLGCRAPAQTMGLGRPIELQQVFTDASSACSRTIDFFRARTPDSMRSGLFTPSSFYDPTLSCATPPQGTRLAFQPFEGRECAARADI